MDVSDKGSDQSSRKKRISAGLAGNESILYLSGDCFLHNFHNAVKDGLKLIDELLDECFNPITLNGFTKYFSSLSKLVHFWREKAKDIMTAWEEVHDPTHHHPSRPSADGANGANTGSEDAVQRSDVYELLKLGRRYPLCVVSGRWGSVEAAEEFILQRGRKNILPVLLQVLSRSMKHCNLPTSICFQTQLQDLSHMEFEAG